MPSQINPPTIPVQTRLDINTIASLVRFYEDNGLVGFTKSGVVRQACLDFLSILVEEERVVPSTSIEQSLSYLNDRGMGYGSRKPNVLLAKEIRSEARDIEKGDVPDSVDKFMGKVMEKLESDKVPQTGEKDG